MGIPLLLVIAKVALIMIQNVIAEKISKFLCGAQDKIVYRFHAF